MENPSKEQLENWHKDPNNWKWGSFYFNPEDKRLFPPKRIPWMGWTINFANSKSIFAFLVVLVIIITVIFLTD